MLTMIFCVEVVVTLLQSIQLSETAWTDGPRTQAAVVKVVPTNEKSSEFTRRHPSVINIRITSDAEQYNIRVQRNTRVGHNDVPVLTVDGTDNILTNKKYIQVGEFYQAEECGCFFIVKFPEEGENTDICSITGTFYQDGLSFIIQPRVGNKNHVMTKQPIKQQHESSFNSSRPRDLNIEELPMLNVGRLPRRVQLYRIELLVAVDFSVYNANDVPFFIVCPHQVTSGQCDVGTTSNASTKRKRFMENIERLHGDHFIVCIAFSVEHLCNRCYTSWRNGQLTSDVTSSDVIMEQIIQYYSLVVNAIDARFSSISGSGYAMDVVLSGIFIADNATRSPWTERTKSPSSQNQVTGDVLQLFGDWLKQYKDQPISFDHAMAFTSYNLVHDGNEKTLGLAFQQSMCTDKSYSLIEDGGNIAYTSYIAAHELAHSLGAKHDGEPVTVKYGDVTKSCDVNDGYLMMPRTSKTPSESIDGHLRSWRFSECSILYFDFYIDHLSRENNNCLTSTTTSPVTNSYPVHAQNDQLQLHPDVQCELAVGHGSYMIRNLEEAASICRRIPCADPTRANAQIPILTLEGTICGFNKICRAGRCEEDDVYSDVYDDVYDDTQHADSACVFGDQPSHLLGTAQKCSDLLSYQCYSYDTQCCHACAVFRRDYTRLPECRYGDRKKHCSELDCSHDLDVCCETCAILQGNLSVCPDLQQPNHGNVTTNTGTTFHGSVATFSCLHGYSVHGNTSKTCLETGEWSSDDPACIYGCPVLKARRYSTVTFSEGGTMATFDCKHGLILQGTETLECRNDSTWSDDVPYCSLQFASTDRININENVTPGSRVHQLSTGHAAARFALVGYSSPGFDVSDDGDVIVSEGADVDFERVQTYTLYLQATRMLDYRFRAKQVLTIHVQDMNEYPPEFTQASYCVEINMSNSADVSSLGIHAIDADIANTNITYDLMGNAKIAQCISLDRITGEIRIASNDLLRELGHGKHGIPVQAIDSGEPWRRTGTSVLDICVGISCDSGGVRHVTSFYDVIVLVILLQLCYYHSCRR